MFNSQLDFLGCNGNFQATQTTIVRGYHVSDGTSGEDGITALP
jgi:hypothetical protein